MTSDIVQQHGVDISRPHTPTPWAYRATALWYGDEGTTHLSISGQSDPDALVGGPIVSATKPSEWADQTKADYARIVACVNACEGISNEALAAGAAPEAADTIEAMRAEIERLRAHPPEIVEAANQVLMRWGRTACAQTTLARYILGVSK